MDQSYYNYYYQQQGAPPGGSQPPQQHMAPPPNQQIPPPPPPPGAAAGAQQPLPLTLGSTPLGPMMANMQQEYSGYYYRQQAPPPAPQAMVPGLFPPPPPPPVPQQQQQQQAHPAPAPAPQQAHPAPPVLPPPDKKRLFNQAAPPLLLRMAATYPRKRALTACDTCRLKKVKCDNVRPRCGLCVKNGITNCHYRTDDLQKDYLSYDPALLTILTKLDTLIKEVGQLKGTVAPTVPQLLFHFDRCFWDMLCALVLRWPALNQAIGVPQAYAESQINGLINAYQRPRPVPKVGFELKLKCMRSLELIILDKFLTMINSFFINCHTKLPILDAAQVMELIHIYTMLHQYDNLVSFGMLLDCYDVENDDEDHSVDIPVPDLYLDALKANGLADEPWRRRGFTTMCKLIPLLMIMCAIGVLSTPVLLDNLDQFELLLAEAELLAPGALSESDFEKYPPEIPRLRLKLLMFLSEYAKMVCMCYPFPKTLRYVEYLLLHGVYSLYTMMPLKAYSHVTDACHNIMFYLQTKKVKFDAINDPLIYDIPAITKERVDRLFWLCLKLECELRVELSPFMPLSGITQITPPLLFLVIPPPVEERRQQFSPALLQLAAKYDDEFSWYYFLTEIAVRKVDNRLFDELYSFEQNNLEHLWDHPSFYGDEFWVQFIKYLDQYNGIINSLSPLIRQFVLYELDVDAIYKRVKAKHTAKHSNQDTADVVDTLEDFLVDDDILLRAQSEQVIYIKTRVVTSKLFLIRPIVHFILNDRIPIQEIYQAAMLAVRSAHPAPEDNSPELTITNGTLDMWLHDTDMSNPVKTPHFYQKRHPDEDFSDVAEYDPEDNQLAHGLHLRDVVAARTKILKVFFQNIISLPKMHIPKLMAHRHMSQWFMLRNQFILTICLTLLYRKFEELARDLEDEEATLRLFEQIVLRELVVMLLEHHLIVFGYWLEECPDCQVYIDYAQRLLEILE